jgi:WD40 repeat protein
VDRGPRVQPDGRRLAATPRDAWKSELCLWDLTAGGEPVALEGAAGTANNGVAFSPDGHYLVAAGWGLIKLWDAATGRLLQSIPGHHGEVFGVAFKPDGRQLASAGADGTVRVWQVPQGTEVRLFRGHRGPVRGVAFSADGMRLASSGTDGLVKVWDLTFHPEYAEVLGGAGLREPEALAFADGGARLVVARRGGQVGTLECDTQAPVGSTRQVGLTGAWLTPAEPACLDPDGRWLAGVSADDPRVARCWDARTGQERVVLRGHKQQLFCVTLSRDGRRIATCGSPIRGQTLHTEVKVWDGVEGLPLLELDEPNLLVTRLALSPEGDRLALAGQQLTRRPGEQQPRAEAVLRVYDLDRGEIVRSFAGENDPYLALAFGSDGTHLAAAGYGARIVLVWDLTDERPAVTHQGPEGAMDVALSPDGRRLAVASRLMVKLLDAATGEEVLILRGVAHAHPDTNGFNPRVRFSPDGQRVAAICHDLIGPISLWSVEDEAARDPAARLRAADRRAAAMHAQIAFWSAADPKEQATFLFHMKWLDGVPLTTAEEYFARGELYARAGRWEQAAPYFEKYFSLGGDDLTSSARATCLPLYLNDQATYRQNCRQLLERFGRSEDPEVVMNVLWWGLLVGDAGVDPQLLLRMADRCLDGTEKHTAYQWMVQAKGMAEYRAGRMEQAVEWLRKAESLVTSDHDKVGIHFFLSMAYQRLHRGDEAKAAYQQGLRHLEKEFGALDHYQPGKGHWMGWLRCQVLRREAEAVLQGKEAGTKP